MVTRTEAAKAFEAVLEDESGEDISTARKNVRNRQNVIDNWELGPEKASVDPKANGAYWQKMADIWEIDEAQARRQLCANCEYFNNTPDMQEKMESIPLDQFDRDGGGRGYCTKFDFICHNLRTCQAWEEKPFAEVEGEDMSEEDDAD